ncbi:MAG: membrane-anchored protein YejM (alkaline phosphatase superfamily) [Patiriisocius sp.]|jgi:membrane-anchored protein YejM (alkaline phosphatase superfamily)
MIYDESPRRKQITQQVSWGHWFAFANILMATAISSVYLFSLPIADTPISFVYLITTWLGHTSFITFLGFIILVMPLCYKITNLRLLKATASVIAAVGLALLAFDALLYNKTGFHITFSSAELVRNEAQGQMGAFGWLQWFYLVLLFIIWLMFQLVVANAIFKRIGRFQRVKAARYIIIGLVLCFISSHAIHVWADARLYNPVLKQDNMFPLSYPATAKTLMARYGFIDLEERDQQEKLQYNSESSRFNYPPKQVYCSVDNTRKVIVLASLDIINTDSVASITSNQFHLNLQREPEGFARQLLFGIPSNLLAMTSGPAVATELLNAFNVTTDFYTSGQNSQQEFDSFSDTLRNSENGFFMGIVSSEQMDKFDLSALKESAKVLVIGKSNPDTFKLWSNFVVSSQVSSNEDIIPTVLSEFGCLAPPIRFSTGQTLQNPTRQWLVSTQDNNLVVVKYPLLTKVAKDGSYQVTNITTQSKVLIDLDTNLLSRSIKHLKDFSDK